MIDHRRAIWSSLPPAPWPSRWTVEQVADRPSEFAIALSRTRRQEVRLGVEVDQIRMALVERPGSLPGVEMVGIVMLARETGGLMGACERAAELAMAHLVMET